MINSVNGVSPSFNGIRKVVYTVIGTDKPLSKISMAIENGVCKPLGKDTFSKRKPKPKVFRITQFFKTKGNKLVGFHTDFADGGYAGERTFKDGTRIRYNASRATNHADIDVDKKGQHLLHYDESAYNEKGKQNIPTYKDMMKLYKHLVKNFKDGNFEEVNLSKIFN